MNQHAHSARFLVVDPHPAIRLLLCAALSDQCSHIDAASTFAEAQALLADGLFDAILCESHLPDASGLRFYQEVRRLSSAVPFVMICGGHPVSLPDPKFRFLAKPFRLAELEETMRGLGIRDFDAQGARQETGDGDVLADASRHDAAP